MELMNFDINAIRAYLQNQSAPVAEPALLKFVTGFTSLPSDKGELYTLHFSLYHALYKLRFLAGKECWYLHLDPIRIRLISIPGGGRCAYYHTETGAFCGKDTGESQYCTSHAVEITLRRNGVTFDPMRDFYLNEANIVFGQTDIFRKLVRGVMVYAFRKGEIEAALKFFGLTNPNRRMVQKRYRELAHVYHPDIHQSDDSQMKLLNHSYQVLREVFVV